MYCIVLLSAFCDAISCNEESAPLAGFFYIVLSFHARTNLRTPSTKISREKRYAFILLHEKMVFIKRPFIFTVPCLHVL